jgi:hypothetical protein
LTNQIEDGYRKYTPWIKASADDLKLKSKSVFSISSDSGVGGVPKRETLEPKWSLFGPYMNYSVIYSNEYEAWLQYDNYNTILASMYVAKVHLVIQTLI